MENGVENVRDKHLLERHLRRNPGRHLYELGDLDDAFWPRTRWFGLFEGLGFEVIDRYGEWLVDLG